LYSQNQDSLKNIHCRNSRIATLTAAGSIYSGGMVLLHQLWYKEYPQSSFHFFNDNKEWLQMDKIGHAYSAYQLGELGYNAAKLSCFTDQQSVWGGAGFAMLFLTTVEVFDGFSAGWGASSGDIIANTAGTLLFAGQQRVWNEQRLKLKFSYIPGKYAKYRPDLLGNTTLTSILKDYNAQTYWLSFSPTTFCKKENTFWPDWLCLSFGYSGDGMLGGVVNPSEIDGNALPTFNRQRQFFLSMDFDLSKIRTQSRTLKILFNALNAIKIPFPALSYQADDNIHFHCLYF
jgi:hypothetical protein